MNRRSYPIPIPISSSSPSPLSSRGRPSTAVNARAAGRQVAASLFVSCLIALVTLNLWLGTPEQHVQYRSSISAPSGLLLPSAGAIASAAAGTSIRRGDSGKKWDGQQVQRQTQPKSPPLGTLVVLAGRRNEISMFNTIDRFCLLLRAIRSFDLHVNRHYGPYPIHVLLATDHDKDDMNMDAPYTEADRALLRSWAPHSKIVFVNVTLYAGDDARSPGVTDELVQQYRERQRERNELPPVRIGYAGMCRLWSFRLQNMEFLTPYRYYMRMDDDSILVDKPSFDPFLRMQRQDLQYAWRRNAHDLKGVSELWSVAQPFLTESISRVSPFGKALPGLGGSYSATTVFQTGLSPYNNFHVSAVNFWRSQPWKGLMEEVDRQHIFYSAKLGDATAHAMATMLMKPGTYEMWPEFPYRHNTNDMGHEFHKEEYKQECKQAYINTGITVPTYEYRD